ncbi:AMP-binding protein [Pseudosporangium ferrugineum]|uniref:Amino acid adenylation domain-containing protein n=1 Tax=Pseudosporangium ferrugineum TaxID=439699 RepID=A0A2T0RFF0_9ACTN|nr:AMP-binding protein [Pseudosporangium ferrugineum]PRY19898.1 amino acid adenylation domain-containing protein [Pseudosporangium ferrugineum]
MTVTSLWTEPIAAACLGEVTRRLGDRTGPAVVDGDRTLDYAELSTWVAEVSGQLVAAGVTAGDRVAVTGRRSAEVIAAMLATASVGAAYVPLDAEYPTRRLVHMLVDCDAALLLHTGDRPNFAGAVPSLRIPGPGENAAAEPLHLPCDPERPVYVIYTSGSTGRPKGVALPHRSIDNMAQWQAAHSIRPDLRTAQFAPMNFDVWFQEVLGTLYGGGTVFVMPELLRRDPIALLDWLADERIERLFLPGVALQMLALAAADDDLDRLALREVNVAGEQLLCSPAIREFFGRMPDCRFNNHYGQSESAMVTVHTLSGPPASWPALPPIGRPLPGCELLVAPLDPAEPHVGELLVAGAPLAVGYLNQPELNAERYRPVPPTPRGNTRVFHTGDLVRIEDGQVQFLSRLDEEVKIRGVRVNPLEVDACLVEQRGVDEAVCVPVDVAAGSRQLRAVVTLAAGQSLDADELRRALAELLPAQSIPVTIEAVTSLPRTPSGKIDRKAVAESLLATVRAS